ncbi:MAG: flagellar basal body P-ring formation chaperone FlgA [Halothiobacillus sp.]|jgi:flagella basal body P-ring formation protein FlgA|nr:flagellar basal body P-ring formation chaperone FlgA [Halothiobacillus sp.]
MMPITHLPRWLDPAVRRTARGLVAGLCLYMVGGLLSITFAGTNPEFQSTQSIEEAVQTFLKQRYNSAGSAISFHINRLDPRLKLKLCDQPLRVYSGSQPNPRGGRVTAQVACEGSSPWRIYVPAQIRHMVKVLSLARPLAAGDRVTAQDLMSLVVNANQQAQAYLTDPSDAIGQVVSHPMQAGQILTKRDLNIAQIVHRGDHVTLISGTGGITVSAEGVAQADAGQGQRLMVKNSRSGQLIEGIVQDAHTVVVP